MVGLPKPVRHEEALSLRPQRYLWNGRQPTVTPTYLSTRPVTTNQPAGPRSNRPSAIVGDAPKSSPDPLAPTSTRRARRSYHRGASRYGLTPETETSAR